MRDEIEFISRGADTPKGADFAVVIRDGCMLPYISPGQRVYVSCKGELAPMEVGLFLYCGRVLCRQWCEDYAGSLLLLCANPALERENISVPAAERRSCLCLGRVLLNEKLPSPEYY